MPDPFEAKVPHCGCAVGGREADPVCSANAQEKIWLPFMKNELGADENSIIVGHSSGAEAAMRFIEEHKVRGVVLVAACHTDLGLPSEAISGYYNRPWSELASGLLAASLTPSFSCLVSCPLLLRLRRLLSILHPKHLSFLLAFPPSLRLADDAGECEVCISIR
eukprot:758651-Hanusia_phi.AAC.6